MRSAYIEQVRRIAPEFLFDRETELAELAAWCTSTGHDAAYVWWRAPAWSGKSALLSWFVLHPPRDVRVVSFFITARLSGQNDKTAFAEVVLEQLAELLGRPLPELLTDATRDAHLLSLLDDAATACRQGGQRFVLVVDGLDEDRGVTVGPDGHSVAALLPAQPPEGMRIVVAGRPDPPIPQDVPEHHPLRDRSIVRVLPRSKRADVVRIDAQRELSHLLRGTSTYQDLLGLVAGAGGGLTGEDLAELTGLSTWDVDEHLRAVTGRTFSRREAGSALVPAYLLAHEQLQQDAVRMLGKSRLAEYRQRLHVWADGYRGQGWPPGTPEYLLRGYFLMLRETGETSRLAVYALDRARHARMLDLVGGDSTVLAEVAAALDALAARDEPDLLAMVRLAICRSELHDRNFLIPVGLPEAWSRLGQHTRAEALARALPDPVQQARALVKVARAVVAATGDHAWAESIVRTIAQPKWAVEALSELAAPTSGLARTDALLATTENIGRGRAAANRPQRPGAVDAAVAKGDLRRAEQLARRITGGTQRARALALVAKAFATAGDINHAETIARTIKGRQTRVQTLAALIVPMAEAGDAVGAEALAIQVETMARTARAHRRPDEVIAVITAVMAAGDISMASALAGTITEARQQAAAVTELAATVAAHGDVGRAETLAGTISEPRWHALALVEICRVLAAAGDTMEARRFGLAARVAARTVRYIHELAEVSAGLAAGLAVIGDLEDAESLARHISSPRWRDRALTDVIASTAIRGHLERAESLVEEVVDSDLQSLALVTIVRAMVGDEVRAVAVANSITEPRWRARALTDLLVAASAKGCSINRRADEARTAVDAIAYTSQRAQALAELVTAVAEAGELGRAETLAHEIAVPYWRGRALRDLAVAVAETGDLQRARALASIIGDPDEQARALADVASRHGGIQAGQMLAHVLRTRGWIATLDALALLQPAVVLAIGDDLLAQPDASR